MSFETLVLASTALDAAQAVLQPWSRMTTTSRRPQHRAIQMAEALLARDWRQQLPVDITGLCDACRVGYAPAELDERIGALLEWNVEKTGARIVFNTCMSAAAQRHAIAQALGKVLLGDVTATQVARQGHEPRGFSEANEAAKLFALHALIPTYGMSLMTKQYPKMEALAAVYGVSTSLMATRIITAHLSGR